MIIYGNGMQACISKVGDISGTTEKDLLYPTLVDSSYLHFKWTFGVIVANTLPTLDTARMHAMATQSAIS